TALILGAKQYTFGSAPKAQAVTVTIPEDFDTTEDFVLSDGVLQVNGYGDPIGNHRHISPTAGRSPNFTAVAHKTYFGAVPEVRIVVSNQTSGIENIVVNDCNTAVYYNLNGVVSDKPFKGVNIIKLGDGSVKKVYIK
ncbi:MAG: hypothetical protein K2J10_08250, partial [Muribaculaceae bacterium]|nr:hypothetical protein [Muribaculaceae bacterium]